MKLCVLMGSPRAQGNTAALLEEFLRQWKELGEESQVISLSQSRIEHCLGCMACQACMDGLGCVQQDDFAAIFQEISGADLILLATPIYAWYCTAPMKALLDRAVYAANKNYGPQKGPALLAGGCVASLTTCGYPPEKGADLWEEGLRRMCRHSKMNYLGMFCGRDLGRNVPFLDEEKRQGVRAFARTLHAALEVTQHERIT